MKKLNLQELHDIMMGCAILGTGGGGSLTEGASVVEKQWNAGKEFKLLDFSEIQDDAYYASQKTFLQKESKSIQKRFFRCLS